MKSSVLLMDFSVQSKQAFGRAQGVFTGRLTPVLAFLTIAIAVGGCAHRAVTTQPPVAVPPAQPGAEVPSPPSGPPPVIERQPAVAGAYVEEGVASWYGNPFNGRRTSNGEIYDMHQFTAAHRTLPFGSIVRVTNTTNGKQVEVRINDRGPFVANRVIDLSLSAAQVIDMVGPGTSSVRLEIVGGPNPQTGYFGVQVGAFQSRDNADRLRAQLDARYGPATIAVYDSPNGVFYRVRAGRLPSENAARQLADQLRANEQMTGLVVRIDD